MQIWLRCEAGYCGALLKNHFAFLIIESVLKHGSTFGVIFPDFKKDIE